MRMNRLAIISLAMVAPVIAGECQEHCYSDYRVSVSGEALYWKPASIQLNYGEFVKKITDEQTERKELYLSPKYTWGFRLWGEVADHCLRNFASLEWAYVNGTSTTTTKANGADLYILPVQFSDVFKVDAIFARQSTTYNKFSFKVGHRLCGNDFTFAYAYAGARWMQARVLQSNRPADRSVALIFETQTEFCGGGAEIGMGGHADVWCGFGLTGRVGLLGLSGRRSYNTTQYEFTSNVRDNKASHTTFIGGLEARIGIDYLYECSSCWIRGEVGYEINYYLDALIFPILTSGVNNWLFARSSNFGIGGIYFGLTFGF